MKSLKDIDWKQFFIEKGERVGLGVAVLLMVVMTVVSLFLPDHGFLVPSPAENAEKLTKVADQIEQKQRNNTPGDTDKPPPVDAVPVSFRNDRIENAKEYEVPTRTLPPPIGSTKRRVPRLYNADEGLAIVALSQIRTYAFDSNYTTLEVFKDGGGAATTGAGTPGAAAAGTGTRGQDKFIGSLQRGTQQRGSGPIGNQGGFIGQQPAAAPGGGAIGRPGAFGPLGRPGTPQRGLGEAIGSADKDTNFITTEKMTAADLGRAVERVRPLRQAIVYATFPYKKQVEEFQRKLHLDSLREVIDLQSADVDKNGGALPAFRFLGVDVQRRELQPDGQVTPWQTLDLTGAMRRLIVDNGMRFETDPEKLRPLIINGLWMRLLKQFDKENRFNHYEPAEDRLANVQKTLDQLKGKDGAEVALPKNPLLDRPDFDPFDTQSAAAAPAMAPESNAGPLKPLGGPGGLKPSGTRPTMRAGRGDPSQPEGDTSGPDTVLPDHVLVRVVDVTIEPGKVYEYRLHVRMANPNYKMNAEVLSPSYAVEKELSPEKDRKDSDWYVIPTKLAVPPEFYYYAVDQKELDNKENKNSYRGIHYRDTPIRDQQTAFQIQRWLEETPIGGSTASSIAVGEWTVAERVLVWRGEYIGRTERVDVPYWRQKSSRFVLAVAPGRSRVSGIDVPFSVPGEETILADFEGGAQHYERRTRGDRPETTLKLDENISTEVLLVGADGRVTARNGAYDAEDPDRRERLNTWHGRIREIQSPGPGAPGAPGGSPFGPINPGGGPGRPPGGRPGPGSPGGIG